MITCGQRHFTSSTTYNKSAFSREHKLLGAQRKALTEQLSLLNAAINNVKHQKHI